MQHCSACGSGELKIVAAILERPAIEKILVRLCLDPQAAISVNRMGQAQKVALAKEIFIDPALNL